MKRHLMTVLALCAGMAIVGSAAAESGGSTVTYEKGKVYGPIVELGDEPRTIDGNGAIIDGGGTARCATLGPNVTLKNFTFRNGRAAVGGGVWGGRLEDCTITGCTATEYGAAVANCKVGATRITGCTLPLSSSKVAVHGGIAADSTLEGVTITGCSVSLGASAPGFGGIAANSALTGCTVTDNALVVSGDHYGLLFYGGSVGKSTIRRNSVNSSAENIAAYMKVTPEDCTLDETGPTPPGPTPEDPFDGTAANNYVVMLQDGSTLVISTARQTVKGGVAISALTAKLTVGKRTYSYAGGQITDGKVTELPLCKTSGVPQFETLTLSRDEVAGRFGHADIGGNRLKEEDFEVEFIEWKQMSPVRVGVAFAATLSVSGRCGPVNFSASKLPTGLKVEKGTGAVAGVPTKAKSFLTQVTATSTVVSRMKAHTDFPIEVAELDEWAFGTFNGGGDGCQVKITISKTGKISGQLLTGGFKWTLSAKSFGNYGDGVYYATLDCKNGRTVLPCEIELSADGLVGAGGIGGAFTARRNSWKEYPWDLIAKGFPKAGTLDFPPVGEGFDPNDVISLKFSASGAVTAKGKFVKSYGKTGKPSYLSISCSTALCPLEEPKEDGSFMGTVQIYYPPKAGTPLAAGYVECVPVLWTGSRFELIR